MHDGGNQDARIKPGIFPYGDVIDDCSNVSLPKCSKKTYF